MHRVEIVVDLDLCSGNSNDSSQEAFLQQRDACQVAIARVLELALRQDKDARVAYRFIDSRLLPRTFEGHLQSMLRYQGKFR